MSTGAMDVEAGTKLKASSCHVQAAHGPVVSMVLYATVSCKESDEQKLFKLFPNEKEIHKHECSKLHV